MKPLKYILSSMFLFFLSEQVYASGYEDVSLAKTILQLVFYLIVFVVVIFITLYGTKFIAKNYKAINNSKYMKIIDVLNIQNGNKLIIVNVNKRNYILSISNTGITLIDTIESEDFGEEDFQDYLNKHINKKDTQGIDLNLYINKIKDKFEFSKDKEDKR